jgi:Ca2+-binding EF-hand superfamily protein
MKPIIAIISLLAIFTVLTLPAQELPRPQASVEQRFKQWDKNGDGKLTAVEVPGPQLFKMLDKNGDGIVTLEEARPPRPKCVSTCVRTENRQ